MKKPNRQPSSDPGVKQDGQVNFTKKFVENLFSWRLDEQPTENTPEEYKSSMYWATMSQAVDKIPELGVSSPPSSDSGDPLNTCFLPAENFEERSYIVHSLAQTKPKKDI